MFHETYSYYVEYMHVFFHLIYLKKKKIDKDTLLGPKLKF